MKEKKEILNDKNIYPISIIADRYTGTYSGGVYLAFNLDFNDIPPQINGSDIECKEFWDNTDITVGKGDTVELAIINLKELMCNDK